MDGQGKSPGQRGADIDCTIADEIASEDPYRGKELYHGSQNPSLGGRSQLANVDDDGAEIQTNTDSDDDASNDEHGNVDGACFDSGTEAGDAKADGHYAWSTHRIGETARKYGDDGRWEEDRGYDEAMEDCRGCGDVFSKERHVRYRSDDASVQPGKLA